MKNKGNIGGLIGGGVLLFFLAFFALMVFAEFDEVRSGCTVDENGTVHNCTLTQENYYAVEEVEGYATASSQTLSYAALGLFAVAAVFIVKMFI